MALNENELIHMSVIFDQLTLDPGAHNEKELLTACAYAAKALLNDGMNERAFDGLAPDTVYRRALDIYKEKCLYDVAAKLKPCDFNEKFDRLLQVQAHTLDESM